MLKLISLNIEGCRHHERIVPFFEREQPDILALQEVVPEDVPWIGETLGLQYHEFLPNCLVEGDHIAGHRDGKEVSEIGIAVLSRFPMEAQREYYYTPPGGLLSGIQDDTNMRETVARGLIRADVSAGGATLTIVNTHFTWTHDGNPDEHQYEDFQNLSKLLVGAPPHILVGDLNAPRSRGVWEKFSALYHHDNIPMDITSTIDPELHRAKGLELVIDALFSHDAYSVKNVGIVTGVSDHRSIVAHIEKK
jgi:endonuclease/exonuclease/phosphatase family metal-dependent hydrolase